ncbi:response regulator transcription factor [Altererythrobacter sp. Root672]|uniref:winged helix-turn-helix domain-containing protein n=1 Tax=Altererythrobacter sp. Root672 TaxID=1736584 RepID=UPI0006F3A63F|nr:response regulator transcription factor [Altererythrobacter sp. Root672]KRA84425.1 XRE family transcriptional regulator [Altererythrobacter sp. Root672]
MQVLLIEDDPRVADFVAGGLRQAGHQVDVRDDGKDGLIQASSEVYDVIVLDRMLPNVDGLKILQTLRATGDTTPVLILSALADVDERVRGLKAGGDDYLGKPFALSELLARVDALGRRAPQSDVPVTGYQIDDLEIDLLGHTARRGGRRIDLTSREFQILSCLAEHTGRVVTRNMLLEQVWDYSFDPQTNVIDQHISKLRQKIDHEFEKQLIHTVRGSGYVLRAE